MLALILNPVLSDFIATLLFDDPSFEKTIKPPPKWTNPLSQVGIGTSSDSSTSSSNRGRGEQWEPSLNCVITKFML